VGINVHTSSPIWPLDETDDPVVYECAVDHIIASIWSCSTGWVGRFCDQNVCALDPLCKACGARICTKILRLLCTMKKGIRISKRYFTFCYNGYDKDPHALCPMLFRSLPSDMYFSEFLASVRKDINVFLVF